MSFEEDMLSASLELVDQAKGQVTWLANITSETPLEAKVDGSSIAIPCVRTDASPLSIGKQVVLLKVGPKFYVVGVLGTYTAPPAAPSQMFAGAGVGPTTTGRWYWINHGTATTGNLGAAGRSCVFPFMLATAKTITGIAWEDTGAIASSVTRVGFHTDNGGTPQGGTLLLDAGTVSGAATGVKSITGLSLALAAGYYWLEMASQVAAGPQWRVSDNDFTIGMSSASAAGVTQKFTSYRYDSRPGALSNLGAPSTYPNVGHPIVQLQFA